MSVLLLLLLDIPALVFSQGLLTLHQGRAPYGNVPFYNNPPPKSYQLAKQFQISKQALGIPEQQQLDMDVYSPVQQYLHTSVQMICDVMTKPGDIATDELKLRIRRDQCERCFLGVGLPHANPGYLKNMTKCTQDFLPENFAYCREIAEGFNPNVDMGDVTFTITPDDDVTRGKFVHKCIHTACAGIQAISCLQEIRNARYAVPGNMSTIDFIMLSECYIRKQNEMDASDPMHAALMGSFRRPYLPASVVSTEQQKQFILSILAFFLD